MLETFDKIILALWIAGIVFAALNRSKWPSKGE
jgi:hypothetical protein